MPDALSLSVRAAAQEIAAGRLSAEALTSACLDRIAARERIVGAWHYLDRDAALAAARRRDAEAPRSPLHGIPIAVKDLIDTADMPTGYGSPIYEGHRPAADGACVALARAAGAVVLGKTVTTEFACFTAGKTANPHNPAHTPGGSSSGSAAAVADGMVPLAFGSQTAGSTIRPAAYCGCIGYKPTFGMIQRAGVKALADSLDTIGILGRTVDDVAFFTGVITERPALREVRMPATPPRFGRYRTPMWGEAEPSTVAALDRARAALQTAGAWIAEIVVPPEHEILTAAQETIMGFELVRALAYERLNRSAELSPRLAQLIDQGMTVGADTYDAALAEANAARARLDEFFGPCDAMLVPAAPGEAPPGLGYTGDPVFSRMWTLLGVPCLTLPAIWGDSGLPTGVQLVGRIGEDDRLMAAGLFLERALAETA
ncbi:MAG: amidase [Alphaproteobacteria bacterium]|nr:amidase [Alphaproteobacteria bacterium]MBV9153021.1 amidase [Alphaproteobacteria bacterium]